MQKIIVGKEPEQEIINKIKHFFLTEREEEISGFKASLYLDFIMKEIGPLIYNQAIADAHELMLQKAEELYDLEKRPR
jgi:uncharacterized protein (DUF2164 family)